MGNLGDYYAVGGSGRVIPENPVSIFEGMEKRFSNPNLAGLSLEIDFSDHVSSAIKIADKADIAIVCAGTTSTEGNDRANLSVDQEAFMVGVSAGTRTSTVAITMTPGAILMPWIDNVDGAVQIFLGGQATGTAITDVLFGDYNPSGKTPITFPKDVKQTVDPCPDVACPYSEELNVGYVSLVGQEVTFPFGHGLSYTYFQYLSIQFNTWLMPKECKRGHESAVHCIEVSIRNHGKVAGTEVAQLYLDFPAAAVEPQRILKGFARITLDAGETGTVTFGLFKRDLQIYWEVANAWRQVKGAYQVFVGASSNDIRQNDNFILDCPNGQTFC